MRTVNIIPNTRPVTSLTRSGQEQVIGEVIREQFDGENITRLRYLPSPDNIWASKKSKEKGYTLGIGSSVADIINPADAQRILVDRGWAIKDVLVGSSGLSITTTFEMPGSEIADPITWDLDYWGYIADPSVTTAISVTTHLEMGKIAAEYTVGLYRLMCANGLIAKSMGLGLHRFRHSEWEGGIPRIAATLEQGGIPQFKEMPRGPVMTSRRHLAIAQKLLSQYRDEQQSGGWTGQFNMLKEEFTPFTPDLLSGWVFDNYLSQLQTFLDSDQVRRDEVYAIDLVNAYTSAINLDREARGGANGRGLFVNHSNMEPIIRSTQKLAQMASMFLGFSNN